MNFYVGNWIFVILSVLRCIYTCKNNFRKNMLFLVQLNFLKSDTFLGFAAAMPPIKVVRVRGGRMKGTTADRVNRITFDRFVFWSEPKVILLDAN